MKWFENADQNQVSILKRSVEEWNQWRRTNPNEEVRLNNADLIGTNLDHVNLSEGNMFAALLDSCSFRDANLFNAHFARSSIKRADFFRADLTHANFTGCRLDSSVFLAANLSKAILTKSHMHNTDLTRANLSEAIFEDAALFRANFNQADFQKTNFSKAILGETVLSDLDLDECIGLEDCRHEGPSIIDIRTLTKSPRLPINFLRGIGLSDRLIEYLPSLLDQAIRMYSCFISYSSTDEEFAQRLHADLQDRGVRCWFAPHDMPIGAEILDTIDEAIRLRDKLLLVLSEASIASEWVEDEVTAAFDEEHRRKQLVLFPIRLDQTVFETTEAWARKLQANRHIGDFIKWKDHDAYQKSLERLLRDLQVASSAEP